MKGQSIIQMYPLGTMIMYIICHDSPSHSFQDFSLEKNRHMVALDKKEEDH